jgi:hypothetical protein
MRIERQALREHLAPVHIPGRSTTAEGLNPGIQYLILRDAFRVTVKNESDTLIVDLDPMPGVDPLPEPVAVDRKVLRDVLRSVFRGFPSLDLTLTPERLILAGGEDSEEWPRTLHLLRFDPDRTENYIDPDLADRLIQRTAKDAGAPLALPLDWKGDPDPEQGRGWEGGAEKAMQLLRSREVLLECGPSGSLLRVPGMKYDRSRGRYESTRDVWELPLPFKSERSYKLTFARMPMLPVLDRLRKLGEPVRIHVPGPGEPVLFDAGRVRYLFAPKESRRIKIPRGLV